MAHRFWPTWLGAFFIGGVVLFFLTILWYLPAGRYDVANPYVVYFKGSLEGLDVGSQVEYRGIVVGKVSDVMLRYDKQTKEIVIPVLVQFLRRRDRYQELPDFKVLLKRGLRARLVKDSLISSSSHISLFFSRVKPYYASNLTKYTQIPVSPSKDQDIKVGDLLKSAKVAITTFNDTLGGAMLSVNNTLDGVNDLIGGPAVTQLTNAIAEIKEAAYSLRVLLDYLARHPESLVVGKQGS